MDFEGRSAEQRAHMSRADDSDSSNQYSPIKTYPKRLPLGRTARRRSFERRLRIWLTLLGLPTVVLTGALIFRELGSWQTAAAASGVVLMAWALACSMLFEQVTRPLQTLANVVSALRDDDYSFRARGAQRGDSIGELALEINALAQTLQRQRNASFDALSLAERVMSSMPSPVLAFDAGGQLRLLNAAASRALSLPLPSSVGQAASALELSDLFTTTDESIYSGERGTESISARINEGQVHGVRWSVRRSAFRLNGIPHSLFILTDVGAALREEERSAWQRLIRVLGHEINNSLTPIKSIAGSLRHRLPEGVTGSLDGPVSSTTVTQAELQRGLAVIEDRAASLNRFLQAYQQLTRLPPPRFAEVRLNQLLQQVSALETRVAVKLGLGPAIILAGDSDQLEQLIINLLKNAADAATSADAEHTGLDPVVQLESSLERQEAVVIVTDNGPGLINPANLFVPFYTTKDSGSGIGLVLAQAIAHAHHGTLRLWNRTEGRGCRAELRLPLKEPRAAE